MVLFGQHPSQGTLLKASQFLSEELPIRLSHRVVELESLPDGLSKMPSIEKVKEWYAQSFEVSLDQSFRREWAQGVEVAPTRWDGGAGPHRW
jgi:hypothetical protein